MSYLGTWQIDDALTFPAITHLATTGALTDADGDPAYRVYENETGTPILTGTMSKLDDANTTGFYSEAITLSAANGFEVGKCYTIYITAAVSSVTGGQHHTFQVEAAGATATALATAQTSIDDLPTNAELATALGTADDAVLAAIAALNNLSQANVRTAVGLATANLDTQLDALPTNTELATALGTADDAVLTAIAALNNLSASAAADAVLDEIVEGTTTLRQMLRGYSSALLSVCSGLNGTTAVFRDIANTKDRISATVDEFGNRSAVTLDLT